MSNINNLLGYFDTNVKDLREAGGLTQFNPSDVNDWVHIFSGLIVQGGFKSSAGAVTFSAKFPKQVLGVFMNGAVASAVTLNGFTASASGYWFAIGV
jgi:hypothetical protein